jgi:hypothetical protein
MIAAYNDQTKEAYFYVEVQRVEKKHIEEHMNRMGAGSVDVTPVSPLEWEADSQRAIRSVIEYGERIGFVAVQYGVLAADTRGDGGASIGGVGGVETGNEEEEHVPRTDRSDEENHKRKRAVSPDVNMISLDVMKAVISATGSAVTMAINSSGQAHMEQQRVAEKKLQEAGMKSDAENAQRAADLVKNTYEAQLKANVEAHTAAMVCLEGNLYAKYEEHRLKALKEATAACNELEEEKSKLEKNLQELVQSKVIEYFSFCMYVL